MPKPIIQVLTGRRYAVDNLQNSRWSQICLKNLILYNRKAWSKVKAKKRGELLVIFIHLAQSFHEQFHEHPEFGELHLLLGQPGHKMKSPGFLTQNGKKG